MRTHCLAYALHIWRTEGGYLMLRKSERWCTPHVMHLSADRTVLRHFVPLEHAEHPFRPFFGGFEGEVRYEDPAAAPPISRLGIIAGIFAAAILGAMWLFEKEQQ